MFKRTALAFASFVLLSNASAAVIGMGTNSYYTDTLRQNLISQGHSVTLYSSYTAATLAGLDAYIQEGNSFFNAGLLDTFVFNGGTLVEIPWSFTHNTFTTATKVFNTRTGTSSGTSSGITVLSAADWLLDGVVVPATVSAGREVGNTFAAGTQQVLKYTDGTAMLGYKEYGQGVSVAFNVHLITSDSKPLNAAWSNQIIYNAIDGKVPEPASLALLALGLAGIAAVKRRKA